MNRALLIVSLLVSGAAAAAQAEPTAPTSVKGVTVSQQRAPLLRQAKVPLSDEQAYALMCPRWNCDATAISRQVVRATAVADRSVARPAETVAVRNGAM
jgi:hypothetical protein